MKFKQRKPRINKNKCKYIELSTEEKQAISNIMQKTDKDFTEYLDNTDYNTQALLYKEAMLDENVFNNFQHYFFRKIPFNYLEKGTKKLSEKIKEKGWSFFKYNRVLGIRRLKK